MLVQGLLDLGEKVKDDIAKRFRDSFPKNTIRMPKPEKQQALDAKKEPGKGKRMGAGQKTCRGMFLAVFTSSRFHSGMQNVE